MAAWSDSAGAPFEAGAFFAGGTAGSSSPNLKSPRASGGAPFGGGAAGISHPGTEALDATAATESVGIPQTADSAGSGGGSDSISRSSGRACSRSGSATP